MTSTYLIKYLSQMTPLQLALNVYCIHKEDLFCWEVYKLQEETKKCSNLLFSQTVVAQPFNVTLLSTIFFSVSPLLIHH